MLVPRLISALRRALRRVVPAPLQSRGMAAGSRVARLTPAQREELARNLRRMLRPKTV